MKGRKRTPANLVRFRGNPGHRPINADEPVPRPGRPESPDWLSPDARKHFERIADELAAMRILAPSDFGRIAEAAAALAKAENCHRLTTLFGYTEELRDPDKPTRCPSCSGSGDRDGSPCPGCKGKGWIPIHGKVRRAKRWHVLEESKAWEAFGRAATALGLDPTSRARLRVSKPEAADAYEAFRKASQP